MINKLWSNRIVRGLAIFLAGYWTIGLSVPGPWWSAFMAGTLLVTSAIMFVAYLPSAYEVIKSGELGDDRLSLLGLFLFSTGAVYAGIFGLAWTFAGSPTDWLQTPVSTFSRALFIAGFVLLTVSPGITSEGVKFPNWGKLFLAFLAVSVVAFLFGFNFKAGSEMAEREAAVLPNKVDCPATAPVKVNRTQDGQMLYHMPNSATYVSTRPETCVKSESNAMLAGFKPAP